MNCNTTHYRANSSSVPGDPTETLRSTLARLPEGGLIGLGFLDLDQFKLVNDTLGHDAGDQLLRVMAKRLISCMYPGDMVARQGGDEFVILFGAQATRKGINNAAQRLLDAVSAPLTLNRRELGITGSLGISLAPNDGRDIESLLRCADAAMYRAKDEGRNMVRFFDSAMNGESSSRLDLLTALHHALERDEFRLVYEPKCEIGTRRLIGVEALLRWQSPGGPVGPSDFIPLAEDTGLILPIGEWVLRTACLQNVAWREAGLSPIPVSVNLSRRQLAQGDFPERVAELLRITGLPPEGLEFEVTESALMRDPDRAIGQLHRLRNLGVGLSMDDFGTGYSSLAYLRRLPVQCLKIDRSFLRDVTRDADSAAIVRAIVSLGRELNLRTLAEGVETVEQLDFLRLIGCEEFQGYLLSRPQSATEFALRLRAMRA